MFDERDISREVAAVRDAHAPDALVLDCERDFETLDPAVAEDLALLVSDLDPASHPESWLPPDAPDALRRYAGPEFTVGMPGDGGVAWTRQTDPPTVFVKPRLEGSPAEFVEFLVAEALVEAGTGLPEHFLPFFGERYPDLDAAVGLAPAGVYQLAAALHTAHVGLHTRETFAGWADDHPRLHAAWADAGERLAPRVGDLPGEVARGETALPAAAELACSAVKHDLDLPAPFAALDTAAYREYGAEYAVEWATRTLGE